MLKIRLATVAVLVAVFGLVSVSSASAQYAPCSVSLDVNPISLQGAGDVDVHAESDVPGNWSASNDFNGQTANGSGNTFDFSFSFPEVDDATDVTISVLLVRDDQVTCDPSATIRLHPEGEDDDDDDDGDGRTQGQERRPPRHRRPNQTVIVAGIILLIAAEARSTLASQERRHCLTAVPDLMSMSLGMWTSVRSTANRGDVHAGPALGRR